MNPFAFARAGAGVVVLALYTVLAGPLQLVAIRRGWGLARILPVVWHRIALAALGGRVRTHGRLAADRPLLVLANHVSWLDIVVIGSRHPVSFVAKADVAGWPVFGTLARLQRTVFVDRLRRSRTGETVAELGRRLAEGDAMVLFAEGTSHTGERVLPFRPALVGAVREAITAADGRHRAVALQPLAIAYVRREGVRLGRVGRRRYAWIGDAELLDNIRAVIAGGRFEVELRYAPVRGLDGAADRKQATRAAERTVGAMLARANAGLPEPAPPAGELRAATHGSTD